MSVRRIDERAALPGRPAGAPGTLHGPAVTVRTGVDQRSVSVGPHGMQPWIDAAPDNPYPNHVPEEQRIRKVLNHPEFPNELAMNILKHTGEAGNADQVFWFVARECKRNAPWLDCSRDETWRELAIAVFGGPRANVAAIDRWKRELDSARAALEREPVGWDTHFFYLYWAYKA